ncbi:MAG: hypothetical protein J5544_04225, partial [Clostridia bacterium]|nr:hypothetical protein [Clostridia bacterium]
FVSNGAQTFIIANDGRVWSCGLNAADEGIMQGSLGTSSASSSWTFAATNLQGVCKLFTRLEIEYIEYDDGTDSVLLYTRTYAVDAMGEIFAWGWNGDELLGVGIREQIIADPQPVRLPE